jgi:hypothetical protein
MPIPSGEWTIFAGRGINGTLTFSEETGSLSGTILNNPFVGFFDETSQTLKLLSNPQIAEFSNALVTPLTIYQGSLFHFSPPGTKTIVSVLAGIAYGNDGSDPPEYVTWFAQNPPAVNP